MDDFHTIRLYLETWNQICYQNKRSLQINKIEFREKFGEEKWVYWGFMEMIIIKFSKKTNQDYFKVKGMEDLITINMIIE